jgi:hypothetical protein
LVRRRWTQSAFKRRREGDRNAAPRLVIGCGSCRYWLPEQRLEDAAALWNGKPVAAESHEAHCVAHLDFAAESARRELRKQARAGAPGKRRQLDARGLAALKFLLDWSSKTGTGTVTL